MEALVARVGLGAYRSPWRTLFALLLVIAGLALQLPGTHFESDVDKFLAEDDPIRAEYDWLREQFGRDDFVLIALEPPEVFDLAFLEALRALHGRLEDELPWLDEVQSLVNARQTRGEGDALIVGELLEDWPEDQASVDRIAAIARANPFYRNLYLSEDGRIAGILVEPLTYQPVEFDALAGFDEAEGEDTPLEFLTGTQTDELVGAIYEVLDSFDFPDHRSPRDGLPGDQPGDPEPDRVGHGALLAALHRGDRRTAGAGVSARQCHRAASPAGAPRPGGHARPDDRAGPVPRPS